MNLRFCSRRLREKLVWVNVFPFLNIPNVHTREGKRAYQSALRAVVKKSGDSVFLKEFELQRQGFVDFLKSHGLEPYPPLQDFLNRDLSSFVDEKSKCRK